VIVLLGIGFLAGIVTAISPCVLPVLPILFAGSASGGRRRPYAIVAGLIVSFTVFLLVGTWILDVLGLPQDFLRNVAIGLLFLMAALLIVPQFGELVERPLARLSRRPSSDLGGGFVLGLSLGLVFVPCAGPVLGAVTVVAATHRVGAETVFLTLAYALGAAIPMLLIGLGGRRAMGKFTAFRAHARSVRAALGVVIAATALAIVFNVDRRFQTALPGYTNALQSHIEETAYAKKRLAKLTGQKKGGASRAASAPNLADFGPAPDFHGISQWVNSKPLTLAKLRGKVVLVDFWTYSCINCLRTLPHLEAWYRTYGPKGLVVVGVHTPEFAFEHVPSNVRSAVRGLGVRYPVAIDNDYGTWTAYNNQYWPAEYLIDKQGHVRHAHFGEGEYGKTESLIRTLLSEPDSKLPVASRLSDPTPQDITTAESYLGAQRLDRYAGSKIDLGVETSYTLPKSLPQNELAYGGRWKVEAERIVAGKGARLQLHFLARNVYLVLGGHGKVDVLVDGKQVRTVRISGIARLYTLLKYPKVKDALLELRFTSGISGYAFTFG
jgi:cytochrome c biogenesis protein CcdA/thiol-disulfide isomerase/thioredoxin